MSKVPVCCGREMEIDIETGTFMEVRCLHCGDVVYIKKIQSALPQLLDD